MYNPESIPQPKKTVPEPGFKRPGVLGREMEPSHSVWIQLRLMQYMLPEDLKDHVVPVFGKTQHPKADEVFSLWDEYFAEPFRDYWDKEPSNEKTAEEKEQDIKDKYQRYQQALLETEDNKVLGDEDYKAIVNSFDKAKVDKFLKKVNELLEETETIH
ncbi:MAG: hypothetical protein R3B53_00340 [Candidatus Paceibacterota bacterium]